MMNLRKFVSDSHLAVDDRISADKFSSRGSVYQHHHPEDLLYHRHMFGKHFQHRLVHKNGDINVTKVNIQRRRRRYLADIFTTLVDIQWRYNLLVFTMAFIFSWLIFAVVWYLISFSHGDLDDIDDDWKPCVVNINSFISCLLFSIETQHTIGYGSRHTSEECPEAITLMMIQACFGVIIQALMTGIVFAKLSRPKKRAETLLFSHNACICNVDGELCLMFRVGDLRKSHIVEAHVRALVVKKKVTSEGGVIPLFQFDVNLGYDNGQDRLFLVWPVIVVHKINQNSPFWDIGADDLHSHKFELVVILEGIVESTGMTTQARSSYLPNEILWGHYFERLVTFHKKTSDYRVDFSRFHHTISVDMSTQSARLRATQSTSDFQQSTSTNLSPGPSTQTSRLLLGQASSHGRHDLSATCRTQVDHVTSKFSNKHTCHSVARSLANDSLDNRHRGSLISNAVSKLKFGIHKRSENSLYDMAQTNLSASTVLERERSNDCTKCLHKSLTVCKTVADVVAPPVPKLQQTIPLDKTCNDKCTAEGTRLCDESLEETVDEIHVTSSTTKEGISLIAESKI